MKILNHKNYHQTFNFNSQIVEILAKEQVIFLRKIPNIWNNNIYLRISSNGFNKFKNFYLPLQFYKLLSQIWHETEIKFLLKICDKQVFGTIFLLFHAKYYSIWFEIFSWIYSSYALRSISLLSFKYTN